MFTKDKSNGFSSLLFLSNYSFGNLIKPTISHSILQIKKRESCPFKLERKFL